MDKARSHILEGLDWMNEVSLCNKARDSTAAVKRMEFNNLLECMDKLRSSYQVLEREKTKMMQ